MDRAAVFVDAGYLFAAGSMLIANEKLPRAQLDLDHDAILDLLESLTTELTGLPLLRIYWYDGALTGPTPQHLALAYRPNVKLRLGFLNQQGQQKGVDPLIVADLNNLSRNRAMADAILVTGDEDIRAGVQQAQEFGVRVHLIGIAPARDNQSGFLVQEADSVRELGLPEVQRFLSVASPSLPVSRPVSTLPSGASDSTAGALVAESLEELAERVASELNREQMEAALNDSLSGPLPSELDRRLLIAGSRLTGNTLTLLEKRRIRAAFLAACRTLVDQ